MPGGGFVNLDFFERMGSSPDVTLVSILGEGSFHQVHGGTTTNAGDVGERRDLIAEYNQHYLERRGRGYHSPTKPFHYVGSLTPAARRTRARLLGAPAFFRPAAGEGPDARPAEPLPIPDDLRHSFVEAYWNSREWKETRWLGKWTAKAPSDLVAYQDLIVRARPDWIVETGTGGGGRAFFLATICDLVGHGRVVSIGDEDVPALAEHDRITYIRRSPLDEAAAEEVRALVGDQPNAAVILGAQNRERLMRLRDRYAPLVPVGSYLVFEDTILNGHPVWAGFGPGPAEAARETVKVGEFQPDPALERFGMTFNPGGFLKRVR
jgi:cephalosporin hydroxylase